MEAIKAQLADVTAKLEKAEASLKRANKAADKADSTLASDDVKRMALNDKRIAAQALVDALWAESLELQVKIYA